MTFLSRVTQPREPVWIWERAAVEFERATNQSWRWNVLASGHCHGPHYKSLRKAGEANFIRQIFHSLWAFRPPKHMYLEWNLLGFMELLVFLWFGTFLFEEKAICGVTCLDSDGWSGFPANRGLSRRGKNERFAVAHRETCKRIAPFKETKYDFSL